MSTRLHDSYNSGNGNTYSVDALFSYTANGSTWSDAFDDVTPGNFTLINGGTVSFHVAPYFAGKTGTYLLDVNITRAPTVGIGEPEALREIRTYPNPATDMVTIDLNGSDANLEAIELMAVDGKTLRSVNTAAHEKLVRLPLNEIASGVYFLRLTTDRGTATRKILVQK